MNKILQFVKGLLVLKQFVFICVVKITSIIGISVIKLRQWLMVYFSRLKVLGVLEGGGC